MLDYEAIEPTARSEARPLSSERRLTMLALTCVAFFTACGGAFGIEPLVSAVGPGWAVVMIIVTPFVWSLPIALMVAELSTCMPEEGGYYVWVRETLGQFWAVQEAWWSMSYSVVLLAMFPVLFVSYLTFFIPALAPAADASHQGLGPILRWLVAVLVAFTAMVVNLRGVRDVGRSSKFSAMFVLGAFAVLVLAWLMRRSEVNPVLISRDLASNHRGPILIVLSTLVFNYSGWDNISTYAAEVQQLIEELHVNDREGRPIDAFGPAWWDPAANGQHFLWCANNLPDGCLVSENVMRWEDDRYIYREDREAHGQKTRHEEVFSDITERSFLQTLLSGPTGKNPTSTWIAKATKVPTNLPRLRHRQGVLAGPASPFLAKGKRLDPAARSYR